MIACGPNRASESDRRKECTAGDGGRDQRQVHAQSGLPAPRTQDLRRFLERAINCAERAVGEKISKRKNMDADHKDNATHGENVDRPGIRPR